MSYYNSTRDRDSKRFKRGGINGGSDGNVYNRSPNDLADLISEQTRRLNIAVDIFEEYDLMRTFRKRIGLL